EQRRQIGTWFANQVYPALTPLAIDRGHPFPHLRNRTLNLAVALDRSTGRVASTAAAFAVVQVPTMLGRLVEVAHGQARRAFVPLEDAIAMNVGELFPGTRILGVWP